MINPNNNALHLLVVSGVKVLFQGEVRSVTSQNAKGEFDVLDQHTNFISLIEKGLKYEQMGQEFVEIKFDRAVMQVNKNEVKVFLGLGAVTEVGNQVE